MDKRFWAVVAAILLIFVGIVWANGRNDDGGSSGGSDKASLTNNVRGKNEKNVTLIEYGDYQCPVCSIYAPTLEQVYEKYQNDIKFQFRNFPLQQIHANAFAASRAAEAAGLQGKYWEMNHELYINQNSWSSSSDPLSKFSEYAEKIGMDTAKFRTDFSSEKVNDAINADLAEANRLKLTGTPTFFLNDKQLKLEDLIGDDGNPSLDKFSKLIDAEIKKQESAANTTNQ